MKRTPQTTPHTLLLAGVDPQLVALTKLLERAGYTVLTCQDGSQALQQVLELHPDLLVVETALPTIPAARLLQILRANPKSSEIPFVFLGNEGEEIDGFQRRRDQFLARPLNTNQMLGLINSHFARIEQARQIGGQQQEVEGSLDQMALVDLLQVFGLNQKSGVLHLKRGSDRGAVYLDKGKLINARVGRVEGEKALNRLLVWSEGNFRFTPGQPQIEARIAAPIDHLLMEGLRIADEMAAQAGSLPALHARLALRIPRDKLPQGLRPATRDILLKLEYYPRVADLLDQCPHADFQILQVLRVLREKGVIAESQGDDLPSTVSLLSAGEILTAHQFLFGSGQLLEHALAQVMVLSSDAAQIRGFVEVLRSIPEFEPSVTAPAGGGALLPCELGRLPLSESFALRFVHLPGTAEMAPLWPVFSHHLFGAISLAPTGALPEAERYLATLGRPLAYSDPQAPVGLAYPLKRGDRKGLAKLFSFFAAGFLDPTASVESA